MAVPTYLVVEYAYNPLGFRRSWKYDTDVDGDVDGSDKTYHFAYDERWRMVASFRDSDSSPKEEFVYHNAGSDGYGSSSYIDAVILRDFDANTDWTSAADGVLEQRRYYCQNWRADVVCMITSAGAMAGWDKYSAYGVPYGIPSSDTNGDGTVNTDDLMNILGIWGAVAYPTGDADLDRDIDTDDQLALFGNWNVVVGWGQLNVVGSAGGNRKGYAGYEFEPATAYSIWNVRHRVLNSDLGRWARRDPRGYADGSNQYLYVSLAPMTNRDPTGLQQVSIGTQSEGGLCYYACSQRGKLLPGRWGVTWCQDGKLVSCLCDDNIRAHSPFSSCFRDALEQCTIQHESEHQRLGEPPCPGNDHPCLGACRECREQWNSALCLLASLNDCIACARSGAHGGNPTVEELQCYAETARTTGEIEARRRIACEFCRECLCPTLLPIIDH